MSNCSFFNLIEINNFNFIERYLEKFAMILKAVS